MLHLLFTPTSRFPFNNLELNGNIEIKNDNINFLLIILLW